MWVIQEVLLVLLGLMAVAFLTLLERKLLGLTQNRLGPNKVSISGLLQPILDGLKLFFKEQLYVLLSTSLLFILSPVLLLVFFLFLWGFILPFSAAGLTAKFSSLALFSILGLMAYSVIFTGWSSTSGFSKLGSLRGMLQSLSFEVALILVFLVLLSAGSTFMLKMEEALSTELLFCWSGVWLVLSLMETNRAPFDLLEGESELISGFNIEMGSLVFVFLFLSEYGMMLVLSSFSFVFVGGEVSSFLLIAVVGILLFLRSCFPRLRYDVMMSLMWVCVLPFSMLLFMVSVWFF